MFEEEGEVLKERWLRMAMMEGHHHHHDEKNKFKGGQSRMVVVRIVEQLLSVFSLFEERYRNVKKVLDRNSHTVKRFVSWNVDDDMMMAQSVLRYLSTCDDLQKKISSSPFLSFFPMLPHTILDLEYYIMDRPPTLFPREELKFVFTSKNTLCAAADDRDIRIMMMIMMI
jgi:hypothetical protein